MGNLYTADKSFDANIHIIPPPYIHSENFEFMLHYIIIKFNQLTEGLFEGVFLPKV